MQSRLPSNHTVWVDFAFKKESSFLAFIKLIPVFLLSSTKSKRQTAQLLKNSHFCGKTQQIEYNFESKASHDNVNSAFKVFVFLYNNTRRNVRFKMQSTTDRRKKNNNSSLNAMCHKGKKKQEKNDFFSDWNSWCVLNEKALVTCTVTEKKKCDSYPRNCAELEPVSLYT